MPRTAFFHDEKCLWHVGQMHAGSLPVGGWVQPPSSGGLAESPDSKRRLKSLMDVSGLSARLDLRSAPPLSEEDLLRVHSKPYLAEFARLSAGTGGFVGDNASFGKGSYEYARISAGLVSAAVEAVLAGEVENAYALSRPPGHHCLPDQAMGFCFLANIALAVELAITRHGLAKVAVLDWDVHHGNGTEAIFYERGDVMTISLHQERCFPPTSGSAADRGRGKGEGHNLNIPLLPGGGHAAYVDALERLVLPTLERYRPDLIVIASGYDASGLDPLARMQLHSESYRWMMQQMLRLAGDVCGERLVVAHEGGYSESYVPFCGHALIEALSGERTEVVDPVLDFIRLQQPSERFVAFQRTLIDEQARALGLA
ncbi:Acetoin utilization deacetylase AcuC [Rhizobiales bacterium GAS113]|nr:Acetoin utilization deacetylase AcuC [Rhizobiales bacterium GAS113]